jgi:ADP-heptose:LPS heptosyltransferase
LSKEEKLWAKKFLQRYKGKTVIATAVRSSDRYRDWPKEYYDQLFEMCNEACPEIKFLLLDHERIWDFDTDNMIDGSGFPFRRFISLVNQADGVLTPDTSLLHVAGAFSKKTIALFGPISAESRCGKYKKTEVILDNSLPCVPCWRNAHIPCSVNDSLDESVCMQNIKPEMVCEKIKEMVK